MLDDQYCDTELCLTPGGRRDVRQNPLPVSPPGSSRADQERAAKATDQQQITIFYGSRVCVCDVTDTQARAIICMAKQEMEETTGVVVPRRDDANKNSSSGASTLGTPSVSVRPQLQASPPAAGLSMTRSLQRFLHNRKNRAADPSNLLIHSHGHGHGHGHGQVAPPSPPP